MIGNSWQNDLPKKSIEVEGDGIEDDPVEVSNKEQKEFWSGRKDPDSYPETAKRLVARVRSRDGKPTDPNAVYVVWFCYILGGWKALCSTTVADDLYYEVTYNAIMKETYVDEYGKIANHIIPDSAY